MLSWFRDFLLPKEGGFDFLALEDIYILTYYLHVVFLLFLLCCVGAGCRVTDLLASSFLLPDSCLLVDVSVRLLSVFSSLPN